MQIPYATKAAPQQASGSPLEEIGASGAAFLKQAIDRELQEVPYMLANAKTTDDLLIVRGRAMALLGIQTQITTIMDLENEKIQKLLAQRQQH